MRKLSVILFITLISLALFAAQSAKTPTTKTATAPVGTATAAKPVITEPQTKCEGNLVRVQFKGEPREWYQTTKTCGVVSAGIPVCCCGGRVYENTTQQCSQSKLFDKLTGKPL